jgi:hypothetical protein
MFSIAFYIISAIGQGPTGSMEIKGYWFIPGFFF